MYTYVLLRNSLVVAHCCLTRDSNSVGVTGRPEASSFSPSTNLTSQNLKKHNRELMIKNHHSGLKTQGTTLLNLLPEIQKFFRAILSRERGELMLTCKQTKTPLLSFSHHKWTIPHLILTIITGPGWAKYRDLSVGNKTICHFHTSTIARRRKQWFHLHMTRILFAAKHSWKTLHRSKPLFAGHVVGSRPMKRKKNLYPKIMSLD